MRRLVVELGKLPKVGLVLFVYALSISVVHVYSSISKRFVWTARRLYGELVACSHALDFNEVSCSSNQP